MVGKQAPSRLPKRKTRRKYKNGGMLYLQSGYIRKATGKFINSHLKTKPDSNPSNNRKSILGY
ncbi:MAG: hypothetical protein A2958_01040 [Candidatus Levybacteria bacterium RIFCSPLOWO2_01_FULL_38_13]|nr:MAG: hypothetical protein A2629_00935 [Candidatus Levybacteria bacterium RIFCSPHIGHO2_01_FULL_41_15]OGH34873.1 MAG: hypothetical protein A2958_01040 [Candidatus Levybacteria bacterium RIFCSPLOWO2_01_FULL_38_13]